MLNRPAAAAAVVLSLAASVLPSPASATPGTRRYEYKGLDTCNAPTHSQMADFWEGTSWFWWGIYVGGVSRACPNTNLTESWVDTEIARGWGLMPIWVGPQAPCSTLSHRFSSNEATARDQGHDEAQAAVNRIAALGISYDTPIVYDMEFFDKTNTSCLDAARAFLKGWSEYLLIAPAQVPGVYGSSCASALANYWYMSPRPSFIWGATDSGNPDVYTMACVSSSIWPQRHEQYYLDVDRTANGTTLRVDVDCAQGPMYSGSGDHFSTVCR